MTSIVRGIQRGFLVIYLAAQASCGCCIGCGDKDPGLSSVSITQSLRAALNEAGLDSVTFSGSVDPGDIVEVAETLIGKQLLVITRRTEAFRVEDANAVGVERGKRVGELESIKHFEAGAYLDAALGSALSAHAGAGVKVDAVLRLRNLTVDTLKRLDDVQQYQRTGDGKGIYPARTVRAIKDARARNYTVAFVKLVMHGSVNLETKISGELSASASATVKEVILDAGFKAVDGSATKYSADNLVLGVLLDEKLIPDNGDLVDG